MSTEVPSHFLALPRELRNWIYAFLSGPTLITSGPLTGYHTTTNPTLLSTNWQILYEYGKPFVQSLDALLAQDRVYFDLGNGKYVGWSFYGLDGDISEFKDGTWLHVWVGEGKGKGVEGGGVGDAEWWVDVVQLVARVDRKRAADLPAVVAELAGMLEKLLLIPGLSALALRRVGRVKRRVEEAMEEQRRWEVAVVKYRELREKEEERERERVERKEERRQQGRVRSVCVTKALRWWVLRQLGLP